MGVINPPRSLKDGMGPTERRLIQLTGATPFPAADPTGDAAGWNCYGAEYLHLFVSPDDNGGAASLFNLQPWTRSVTSGLWIKEVEEIGIDEDTRITIEVAGAADRVFLQITSTADADNILNCWGDYQPWI